MRQYAMRRLVFLIPVVFSVSLITFFGLNLIPGDPAMRFLSIEAKTEEIQNFHKLHGLDKPILERYGNWFWGMLRGDPGESLLGGDIKSELKARFPVTAQVLLFAFTLTMFFGLLFGTLAAVFQDSPIDYFVRFFSVLGLSVPQFYALTLLILIPAILWRYAPPLRYEPLWVNPAHFIQQILPPALILSLEGSAGLMRLTRSALLEVLRQDYIRTARSKGLQERAVFMRHAAKNAMIPVLTIAGGLIAGLLGGSLILEQIISLHGLGEYTFRAVQQQDYNVVMTMVTYAAIVIVLANLTVDLLYAFVDPRIRYR